jgi:hypothetical protein
VTDYSGEIQVSSKPGAGTTVSVRLPARGVSGEKLAPGSRLQASGAPDYAKSEAAEA